MLDPKTTISCEEGETTRCFMIRPPLTPFAARPLQHSTFLSVSTAFAVEHVTLLSHACIAPFGIAVAPCLADFYGLHASFLACLTHLKTTQASLLHISASLSSSFAWSLAHSIQMVCLRTESRSLCPQILAGRRVH